jgi:hypothetical protein
MNGILDDFYDIFSVFTYNHEYLHWLQNQSEIVTPDFYLFINPVVNSEISNGFKKLKNLNLLWKYMALNCCIGPKKLCF